VSDRPRIIVGGFIGLLDAGGVTWDYIQYPLGLAALGCDVYYFEDTGLWPVYQENSNDTASCTENVKRLAAIMDDFGLGERWAYRDAVSGDTFGPCSRTISQVCRGADVFVNISCSTVMRDEYASIPKRALIDSDPMFTQIQYATEVALTAGESHMRELVHAHTHHFTFGENIGAPDCRIPACGINWHPTRQPICLNLWPESPLPQVEGAAFTTVMNWSAAPPLEYEGETWGQKNTEFTHLLPLPERLPDIPLAVVVGQTGGKPFPVQAARDHGWHVFDPRERAPDWRSYRRFIEESSGEFSVAKETYVKGRTGWFSCRSACYLAAGRPVVAQDTGWSRYIPSGDGLVAFDGLTGATEALRRINTDLPLHARAARRIAEQHFDSDVVLGDLLRHLEI
jgi:hypothetical protein